MSRKKQSSFEDLIEIAAMMPWWAGLILAIVSYLILHQLSQIGIPAAKGPEDFGGLIWTQAIKMFSMFLQFVFPIAFIFGSIISFVNQRKGKSIFDRQLGPEVRGTKRIDESTPACPKCGCAMVMRTAKRGANTGNQFWGCTAFPKCKGLVNIK